MTTYDPNDPQYLDEAEVRDELTRVYQLCDGCRSCITFCTSFPTLFQMIERHVDGDAGLMTPAEQDRVVDECFQCKLCFLNCPYVPALHAWNIDFPRLMLRAKAMQHANGLTSTRERATTALIGRTDLVGRFATSTSPLADKVIGAKAGSLRRRAAEMTTGVSAVRLLPPHAKQRFSTWFRERSGPSRPRRDDVDRQGSVTVFPTCLVEYHEPGIGKDLVRVYEHNGIGCGVSGAGCCGVPWLHAGDVDHFVDVAKKNVRTLAAEVRAGTDIVVPQPACSYVIRNDYVDYVGSADAELVASNTYDASEYLMNVHDRNVRHGDGNGLATDFEGETYEQITYHTPCHLRAQNIGLPSRDLMQFTGAEVTLVQQCSGGDAMWGLRAGNEAISMHVAAELGDQIDGAGNDVVVGDCHLANTAIVEQTGRVARHPIQILARAYGIGEA